VERQLEREKAKQESLRIERGGGCILQQLLIQLHQKHAATPMIVEESSNTDPPIIYQYDSKQYHESYREYQLLDQPMQLKPP